ncbi:DNA polymerase Y family protein [Sphingomonas sp. LB-2]|uniref:DNA polymerase Y family protein n=1 Tax=Sphingomonas caeni TaxID=2984949 RepID=UPI00222EA286|nr:DNA polymerase Y family protein [Sphingomonas caeni]MCW3846983.1 DNA polymerase Y family protein [Sphingomonas caeni]
MQRVAALFLPLWPIERLWRAERAGAPPDARAPLDAGPLRAGSVPRGGGWRPGARWAREDRLGHVAPLGGGQALGGPAPLITSIREGNRSLVAAACPQAQALGLAPGMAVAQARAQVRGLDIRPADTQGDLAALGQFAMLAARRWSPIVAVEGADTLFLDLTGTAHLFGGEVAMARRIVRLLARAGFTARIAIADTVGAAWALVHHGAGGICPPAGGAQALAPLPTAALRLEPPAIELLKRLGIERIGQLAALPRGPLVRRFGAGTVLRLDQALGRMPEPLAPVIPPHAIAVTRRFAEPIATAEGIAAWLGALVPELAAALEAEGLGARAIELVADRVDGVPQRISIGLARSNRDPVHLLRLLARRIGDMEPGFGIDALALHVRRATPLGPEPVVERLDEEAAPDIATLVDTLATRIGQRGMWRMRPVESDVPERAAARAPVLDPPERGGARPSRDDIRQLNRILPIPPWHPDWPRPARLLARPEPLDHVLAELPDQPPRRFTWRGQAHCVIRADGPERIHGEWWKRDAERASTRDYFRVEDEAGRRYWLFRSGDGERPATGDLSWYLHGVFG